MYNHQAIEKKWQEIWRTTKLYETKQDKKRPKYYVLDMFPYPSGAGLHVGHPKGYIATDVLARFRRMQGYNVLHPMGWDAFGLPTENYAIQNKIHPRQATEKNIATYKKQLEILGFSYDWSREVNTTDPQYYKWTQWAFLEMFKKGLVYESNEPINWCPSCKTGLANEDLEDGRCERCGSEVEQKPLRQWVIKITKYAERLLDDLDKLPDWEEPIKEMQKNWIGRSEGAEINFKIIDSAQHISVFTTRVDTIFGCTYIVLAPEHPLIQELQPQIKNWPEVAEYLEAVKNKTVLQRTDLNKEKTGIILEGLNVINPFNNEAVVVFVADYVLSSYGTGAVMAVPAHDNRDWEFAQKYNLTIKTVVSPLNGNRLVGPTLFTEDGLLRESGEFSNLESAAARIKMTRWLEKNRLGASRVNYKIKDWVFSRQRYWGEPIPLIHCDKCGVVPVPEESLPVVLPEVDSYEPTGTGESPLAAMTDWVNVACPKCGGAGKRETNTMPQWGGSCWYYLRYIDPHNDRALVDKHLEKYWSPVDFYVGGAEHATRHLIYARFWHKFLYDLGVVKYPEPFIKFKQVGLIMGEDNRKMSKRWGNVINPDEMVAQFGADAVRVYEMFMGPFDQATSWNTNGLSGARKFLERVLEYFYKTQEKLGEEGFQAWISNKEPKESPKEFLTLLHQTIKKVSEDIESFHFNTAISQMMILRNSFYKIDQGDENNLSKNKFESVLGKIIKKSDFEKFVQILAPFAPHLSEELWERLGNKDSIFQSTWPQYDKKLIKDETINLVVQVNGKLRATLSVALDISEKEALELARAEEGVEKWLSDKEIIKVVFVPGKLLNIVVK